MDCSTPGFPVHHQLPEPTQIHVHWGSDAIQPSHPVSPYLQSFPASGSFPMSQLCTSGGQSVGVLASASVFPMNIQDWFPLGLTGCISLAVQGTLKSLFQHHSSKASILRHSAFFIVQLSHPYMTTRKTIELWLDGPFDTTIYWSVPVYSSIKNIQNNLGTSSVIKF